MLRKEKIHPTCPMRNNNPDNEYNEQYDNEQEAENQQFSEEQNSDSQQYSEDEQYSDDDYSDDEQEADDAQDAMSFWDHLEAFRWMLIRIIGAMAVFVIGGFAFIPWLFQHVVMAPSKPDFFLYRWMKTAAGWVSVVPDDLTRPFHVDIININLSSQFFLHMSLSVWLALLLTFPYIVFEIWRFVCPALYKNEQRGVRFTFIFGTVMFFMGSCVGYSVVFPLTLRFLYSYQISPEITNQLSLDSYMNNFLMLTFMMGIIFELPLVCMGISKIGLLNRSFFSRFRRHAVVALLTLAAFITPSADPFTLMSVFIPLYVLWELSAFLVKPAPKEEEEEPLSEAEANGDFSAHGDS